MSEGRFRHRLPFGAELGADGRTLFRLWAPDHAAAPQLVIEGQKAIALQAGADGWFSLEVSAGAGTRYRFRLGEGLEVPDPASRAQVGDVHGWSVVVDPEAYRWRHPSWSGRPWPAVVLYELHVGAYGGDFAGVERDLARLKDLGVTAIELMPVADFPGSRNWGYDGVLPFAPDEAYGGVDGLKRLVDAAHGHGLMVFLDVVYNHFGPDGNYLHHYAGRFFSDARKTPWGAAIDFEQPAVADFFIQNALYWLHEFRFDGLRFDAVHAIRAAPGGAGFLQEMARAIRASLGRRRHVHLMLENDDNTASLLSDDLYDAQWNDDAHHCLHVLLTGEGDGYYADFAECTAQRLARCLAQGFAFQGEHSPHKGARRGEPSGHMPPYRFVNFLQNHDQIGNRALGERLSTQAHPEALRAAVALLLLAPQVPMLFMGEEWGSRQPFLYFTDHHGPLAAAVREGRRQEFARFAAFSDPASRDAIPDPNGLPAFESSRLPAEHRAEGAALDRIALYRTLLQLRSEKIVPQLPGAGALAADAIGAAAIRAAWRLADGSLLSVLCNLGSEPVAVPPHGTREVLFATAEDALQALSAGSLPARTTIWHLRTGGRADER